jgi:branched-subunit amino acid aminotransferase/4-amino-4-deoxychorismate lyase
MRMAESFELYEALLWEPSQGYFLLDTHLTRLERSAKHFQFALDLGQVRAELLAFAAGLPREPRKVRLELSRDGSLFLEQVDLKPSTPVRAALARTPVDSADEFLRHKTSRRGVYQRALAARPDAQDVVLWNERRELTESCASNLVLELDGRRLTPSAGSGLLPGTFRCHLLERGEIEEAVLPVDAIARASRAFLINSVRKWYEVRWLDA